MYRAWAAVYAQGRDVQFTYDAVGSTAGLKKIRSHEVAFGASDVAPPSDALARDGLVLVPTFVTGAVPVVNLPKLGAAKLRMTGDVLADIYAGTITRWNDAALAQLNPGVALPDLEIKRVVRSDGSGTTYYFTDYLSVVSATWKTRFGAKTSIDWPAGAIGAKGTDGMVKAVKSTPGAIGYVDFNYVAEHQLAVVQLRNAAGEWMSPGPEAFRAALRSSDWYKSGDFHASLANRAGPGVWPITMGTFVLLPKVLDANAGGEEALRFFVWALLRGDLVVEGMNFVRLPDKMQALAYAGLSSITDAAGRPVGIEALSSLTR